MKEIVLPEPAVTGTVAIEAAIKQRRSTRHFQQSELSLSALAQLLWAAQGVTHDRRLRSAPSAGALYPLELHVVAGKVAGLPAGVYRYKSHQHVLEERICGDLRLPLCTAAYAQECVGEAVATIVICAVFEREEMKYGESGWRYTCIEAGCTAQNLALQAVSLNLGTVIVGAMDAQAVAKVLQLPKEEEPLCLLPFGKKP